MRVALVTAAMLLTGACSDGHSGPNSGGDNVSPGDPRAGDTAAPGDTLSPGDGAGDGDTGMPGDSPAPGDTEMPGDSAAPGDTATPGDAAGGDPIAVACPPPPPYGTTQGEVLPNVTFMDCDGVAHDLHELCGEKASWLFIYAGY